MVLRGELVAETTSVLLTRSICGQYLVHATGPSTIVGLGSILDSWADVCGFAKPHGSQRFWNVNKHGLRPNDQKLPSRNVVSFGLC